MHVILQFSTAISFSLNAFAGNSADPVELKRMPSPVNSRIILLPLSQTASLEAALAASPANPVVVADCYVDGVEAWTPRPWGWQTVAGARVILNIDHHADDERFFRPVSSGNLAIQ